MKCTKCGYADTTEVNFCPVCGNKIDSSLTETEVLTSVRTDVNRVKDFTYGDARPKMSYEEFVGKFASKKLNSNVKGLIICSFLSAAVSLVTVVLGNFIGIIDVAFFLTMSILMMKKKNWIYALIITAYCIIFSVISIATSGTATGIIPIIFGIFSTKELNKLRKAFDLYVKTGTLPESEM